MNPVSGSEFGGLLRLYPSDYTEWGCTDPDRLGVQHEYSPVLLLEEFSQFAHISGLGGFVHSHSYSGHLPGGLLYCILHGCP